MRLRGFLRAAGGFGLLAMATLVAAQKTDRLVPVDQYVTGPAVVDSTYNYFPPIDNSLQKPSKRPANPLKLFTEPGLPNKLVPGGMLKETRGAPEMRFPGISYTGWIPPDPDMAVGPNHYIEVVNSRMAIYQKSNGSATFQQNLDGANFFSGLGATNFTFDPKVFYDPVSQRFVVLILEEQDSPQVSKVLMAVSDDSDPNGTWFKYRLEAAQVLSGNNTWMDYPGMGFTSDAFVVCGNQFGFSGGYGGVQFMILPKATMLTGGSVTVTRYQTSSSSFSVQLSQAAESNNTLYGVSEQTSTSLRVFRLQNLAGGSPTVSQSDLSVPAFTSPSSGAASRGGRLLDALDGRTINVSQAGNRLAVAHGIDASGRKQVRWYEINVTAWPPTLVQSGNVGEVGSDCFMPGIAINGNGDIVTCFTRSNSSTTADFCYAARRSGDAAGSMGAIQLLEASAAVAYGSASGTNRWGDYFDVNVDPSNASRFWMVGMIGTAAANWGTVVHTILMAEPSLSSLTLNPTTVEGGQTSTGTVTLINAAPAGGALVALSSGNTSVATVPANVTVPAGQTSATFTVTTAAVTQNGTSTIGATYAGDAKSADITVQASYKIGGTITSGGSPLSGVNVQVTGPFPAVHNQSQSSGQSVTDFTTTESNMVVTQTGTVKAVVVGVDITHTYRGDLRVWLVHPDGTAVMLKEANGNDNAQNLVTTYPTSTTPVESLDAFIGKPLNGTWKLRVYDNFSGDSGTINSWNLSVTYLANGSQNVTTNASGVYQIANLSSGTFTVTPTLSGYTFTPVNRSVAVGPSKLSENFTANSATRPVSGTITLGQYTASPNGVQLTMILRNTGSTVALETKTVTLDGSGNYSFQTSLQGTYDLAIKGSHWLRKVVPVNIAAGGVTGVNASLLNGDVNGDNTVNISDFVALRAAFGSSSGSGNWNPNADLNGDGSVNLADFLILRARFGNSGDA
ncbi:MAG: proprotein convertase P-domain-containing protein [Fimbriimonadaceae bacterium]|nr:proprotein convertase P-domain-containing protein [Fimbriimonadaceae bacterium]